VRPGAPAAGAGRHQDQVQQPGHRSSLRHRRLLAA
jgi:hypothetical protein